jgi:hypothetical protein
MIDIPVRGRSISTKLEFKPNVRLRSPRKVKTIEINILISERSGSPRRARKNIKENEYSKFVSKYRAYKRSLGITNVMESLAKDWRDGIRSY